MFGRQVQRLKGLSRPRPLSSSSLNNLNILDYNPEVRDALEAKKAVVALETALVTNGLSYPTNIEVANQLERIVRSTGAVPATIGILDGRVKIGLTGSEIERIGTSKIAVKVSRRDIAPALVKKADGGTTCSATLIFAALAGIKVFGTGGLGGVHRGGESSLDVSADLFELSRCPVGLVSSGVKSILDIARTLEYLETLGVPVVSYSNDNDFPAFFSRKSGLKVPWDVDNAHDAASIIYTQEKLGLSNGALFAVPVPLEDEADGALIQAAIEQAVAESETTGISKRGKEATPWLLARIAELTNGQSVKSNIALLKNTALVAGHIAMEYQQIATGYSFREKQPANKPVAQKFVSNPQVLVIGAAAVDITAHPATDLSIHSTTPGSVLVSLGGVARNIAEAAHRLSPPNSIILVSPVGGDAFGNLLVQETNSIGMRTDGLALQSDHATSVCNMTLALNGELEHGVADMGITRAWSSSEVIAQLETHKPMAIVLDANLSPALITSVMGYASQGVPADVGHSEPTSINKAPLVFPAISALLDKGADDRSPVTFTTPNLLELAKMYTTAVDLDLLSHSYWWKIVQGLSLGQQFRNELEQLAREPILQHDTAKGGLNLSFLTRDGVANMAINLLPFFQHVVIKCGEMGVVVVMRVAGMDSSWRGESTNMQQRRIVANGHEGTLVLSHHPPLESPAIVNVTGAGDSFVGALVATMVRDESVDIFRNPLSLNRSIHTAQRAAVLALASRNAVSPALSSVVIS